MKIPVSHPDKPGIHNHSYARILHGDNTDKDTVIWESDRGGYIPVKMENYTPWSRYTNIFGFYTYICETINT